MTKQNLETEYCNERGDSSFNDYNNNDYTKWLETKLIETEKQLILSGVSQQRELLDAYTQFLWTQHNNLTNADNNKIALDKFIASNCG